MQINNPPTPWYGQKIRLREPLLRVTQQPATAITILYSMDKLIPCGASCSAGVRLLAATVVEDSEMTIPTSSLCSMRVHRVEQVQAAYISDNGLFKKEPKHATPIIQV